MNTAFIMNPKGKIILKFRKINPWIPLEVCTSPHDLLSVYNEPLFPVIDTELGIFLLHCSHVLGVEFLKGLKPGERIAVAGVHYLKEGQKVRILSEDSEEFE